MSEQLEERRPPSSSLSMHGVGELGPKANNPKINWQSVMRTGRVGFGIVLVFVIGTLSLAGLPSKQKFIELERLSVYDFFF